MKQIRAIILVTVLFVLTVSCTQQNKVIDDSVNATPNMMIINKPINEFYVTEGEGYLYFIDDGILYAVSLTDKETVEIARLNVVDDVYTSVNSEELSFQFKNYIEMVRSGYLQFIDGYLYFLSEYNTIEGEVKYLLNRIKPDGSQKEVVKQLIAHPYNGLITRGHFFYQVEMDSYVIDLNDSKAESQKLDPGPNSAIVTYLIEEDGFYPVIIDQTTGQVSVSTLDLENLAFETLTEVDQIPISYSNDKLLYQIPDESGNILTMFGTSTGIVETTMTNRVISFMDDKYLYSSSPTQPQVYIVYDHDGKIIKELPIPSTFQTIMSFSIAGFEPMPTSRILGVFDGYLFVLGNNQAGQFEYYLIEIETNTWHKVFTSDYLPIFNTTESGD